MKTPMSHDQKPDLLENENQASRWTGITFQRLTTVPLETLASHMSDARMAVHMPLLKGSWTVRDAASFVEAKEQRWRQDGLGHCAIFNNGTYVGWGGFQKEGNEWDFGLVLTTEAFGLGGPITRKALARAKADPRIPYVTFLLPPSRQNLGALARLGARYLFDVECDGATFRKYRLDTS